MKTSINVIEFSPKELYQKKGLFQNILPETFIKIVGFGGAIGRRLEFLYIYYI